MKLDKAAVARIKNATPKKQKGASSLEYIMLAAVIVAILLVLDSATLGGKVSAFFTEIFTDATTKASPGA